MKRLTLLASILLATALHAQEYRDSKRAWAEGPLTLDEFMGRKPKKDTAALHVEWQILTETKTDKVRLGKCSYLVSTLYFDKTQSWIAPAFRNKGSVKQAQVWFDYAELYRRKAVNELLTNPSADYSSVRRFYLNQWDDICDEIADSTRNGQDGAILDLYAEVVALALEQQTEANPTASPVGDLQGTLNYSVGVNMHNSPNDFYENMPWGMYLSLGFGLKRHLFLLDMNCNFGGECKKEQLDTDAGPIFKGEEVQSGFIGGSYGYVLNPKSLNSFTPFVCMGGTSVTAPKDPDEKEARSQGGFTFGLGCLCELTFYHHTYMPGAHPMNGDGSILRNNHAIVFRPNINFTTIDGSFYPSFNLSVAYCWSLKGFERH